MLIKIESESQVPLFLQLRRQIVEGIVRGELKPGEQLPSVRQFAVDLGINFHTVNKAYSALEAEGFVKIYGRKGVVVAELPPYDTAFLQELEESLASLFLEAKGRGVAPELFETLIRRAMNKN
ncbi:GntR family transcriptional regulator [Spirochaetia bacterium]|nr:GntR family transcriptional regulator [Spirochaetia bacterium]